MHARIRAFVCFMCVPLSVYACMRVLVRLCVGSRVRVSVAVSDQVQYALAL